MNVLNKMKNHIGVTAIIALVVILLVGGLSYYGFYNSTRDAAIQMESDLNGQYTDNMNELSATVLKITETLGVADKSANKVKEIFSDAIQGRYGDSLSNPASSDALFNALAITEDNPDLTATVESYAKVQDVIVSAREAHKNKQTKLFSMVNEYKRWMKSGVVRSKIVKSMGFPSDDLMVPRTDGTNLYGRSALDWMGKGVMEASALESYETGVQEGLVTPEPAPTEEG